MNAIKENDRVVTIGGIYGVVTNVQRDAQRVTVRVDESTGTKLRLNMTAIARVLTADDSNGASQAENQNKPGTDPSADRRPAAKRRKNAKNNHEHTGSCLRRD